jgi:hypothetical protein
VAVTGVDAQILNNSGLVPPLTVSIRENLVLLGDYVAPSTVSTIVWSLSDSSKSAKFFSGVNKAAKDLVIPSENLLDGTSYTVIYTVTDSLGNVGTDSINIETESAITSGTFTVSPSTGTAFDTEFTFAISGFSSTTTIKYDITTFFARTQTINGVEYTERVKTMTIVKGVNAGTYTFIYPVCEDTIPFTVELCAYNDDQEVCITKKITVSNSGELPLQKVIVWTSAASTITDISSMLDFVRSAAYFYTRDWTNLISTNYYRGLLLIKNLVIDKDLVACSKVAECSNSGSCDVSGSSFTCDCESDQGGYNCYYGERDYDTVTGQIADILKNLYQVTLTSSNVETAILVLDQISSMKDLLNKNGILYFRDIVGKILEVEGLEYHHYRYLFSILGETIEFAKRPLTSTWFKTTDQSLLLNNLTSLVETTFNQINTIWTTESYFIADTNFIEVFIVSGVPSTLLGSKSYYSIDFETFGYKIPSSVLSSLNTVSIKLLGYKVNPYGQSQTNSQITSVSKLEIYDVEGEVSITSAADKIVIYIPKLTATPVFVPVTSKKAWNCEFKTTTDGATINFDTTGCSLISENITHISCGCTHLTEFTGQLVVDNVASIPSSSGILDATTDLIASQILYETAKRAYIIETPETPTVIVAETEDIIRNFHFTTNALYIGIVVFAIYIFAILLNMGNRKKNSLKTSLEDGQSILVLTYHPILSLFIHAHTPESNTQLMRISKFFCQLESYIALSGVFYFLLDLQASLGGTSKLIAAAVMTLLIAPFASYIPELAYGRHKKKKNEEQRMTKTYHKMQLCLIVVWFLIGVASVGFIRGGYRGSWLGSLILAAILDLFVLDFVILIFATVKRNNSKLLRCFKRKGYYVDVGSSAIIKSEDEAILLAKIKRVLKQQKKKKKIESGNNAAHDTSRALTFGDKSKMEDNKNYQIEEIEDMNASVDTDANHMFSPEIEMKNMNEDEVPINSKRSIKTGSARNLHQEKANIYVEEDQPQPQDQEAAGDETREKIIGGEQGMPGRRGTRQRTGKPSTHDEDQLFEVNSKLDLDELVNQIDKIARPKPRVVTNPPANNNPGGKRSSGITPSVPIYHLANRAKNRNKNKN